MLKLSSFIVLAFSLFYSSYISAQRLVTAGGSLTEIVYALDVQAQLVAVDDSSHYPGEARNLPNIGYYRALNVEGVLSVTPEKLLLLQGAGPQGVIDQLRSLGVNMQLVNNPKTLNGLFLTIEQVANATQKEDAGKKLINKVRTGVQQVTSLPALKNKTAVFLMSAGERGLVAAGKNTTPQLIFEQLGVTNPFASVNSFKPVSAETLAASNPDIILLASHTSRNSTTAQLCADQQLVLWAKTRGCKLYKVDSLKFIGLTPRLPEALQETYDLLNATSQ